MVTDTNAATKKIKVEVQSSEIVVTSNDDAAAQLQSIVEELTEIQDLEDPKSDLDVIETMIGELIVIRDHLQEQQDQDADDGS